MEDQLQRLLDTKFAVEAAQLANPDAQFDFMNQFSLLPEAVPSVGAQFVFPCINLVSCQVHLTGQVSSY